MTYHIRVTDETGQKHTVLTTAGDTRWEEVGALAAQRLHPFSNQQGDDPIFHLHDDVSGEALLPEQTVADAIREVESEFRVRMARDMRAA